MGHLHSARLPHSWVLCMFSALLVALGLPHVNLGALSSSATAMLGDLCFHFIEEAFEASKMDWEVAQLVESLACL